MENNIIELAVNVSFCPYCGSDIIEITGEETLSCFECGRDFTIMTHE